MIDAAVNFDARRRVDQPMQRESGQDRRRLAAAEFCEVSTPGRRRTVATARIETQAMARRASSALEHDRQPFPRFEIEKSQIGQRILPRIAGQVHERNAGQSDGRRALAPAPVLWRPGRASGSVSATSTGSSSLISPPIGNDSSASTLPPLTITKPPSIAAHRLAAAAMSSSVAPMTPRL